MDSSSSRGRPLALAATDPIAPAVEPPCGVAGQVLAGKYRLAREIGRGGMGSVWQADRLDWGGSPVALKLITLPDTPLTRARVQREVHAATALRSTHVVQVLDHGVDEATGVTFIAMELLEGESLGNRLRRLQVLSPREMLRVVSHIGRALARAHAAGLVHRDLKPDNVFFVDNHDEPIIKVLDFGLAKAFDVTLDSRAQTVTGNVVGTPLYMSPEQLRPSSGGAGPLNDLWSLAVIVFECLVGRRPFVANSLPELTLLLWTERRPIPSQLGTVPPAFDAWFARATHPDVKARFQDVEELVAALHEVCGSSPPERPAAQGKRTVQSRTFSLDAVTRQAESAALVRRGWAVRFAVVVALLAGIGTAFAWQQRSAVVAERATTTAPQALTPWEAASPRQQGAAAPEPGIVSLDHPAAEVSIHGVPGATALGVQPSGVRPSEVPPPAAAASAASVSAPTKARKTKPRKQKVTNAEPQRTTETPDELAEPSAVREY